MGQLPLCPNVELPLAWTHNDFSDFLNVIMCRQYGPLTEDLIAVLLQADPAARPTAAQVLAIPAVRPYAEAYVRRMRAIAERCTTPVTPTSTSSAEQRDTHTRNDVIPEPEVGGGSDRRKCESES